MLPYRFLAIFLLFGCTCCVADELPNRIPYYKISGVSNVKIVPSIHSFLTKDVDISDVDILSNDTLYLEYDVVSFSSADINPLIPPKYTPTKSEIQTRKTELSGVLQKVMQKFDRSLQADDPIFEVHPYILLSLLDQRCANLGYGTNSNNGLDKILRSKAANAGAAIRSLETFQESVNSVAALSNRELIPAIIKVSEAIISDKCRLIGGSLARVVTDLLLAGDLDNIFSMINEFHRQYYGTTIINEAYVSSLRNTTMTNRIVQLIRQADSGGSYLFVIGATHFPGEGGIVNLLCKRELDVMHIDGEGRTTQACVNH